MHVCLTKGHMMSGRSKVIALLAGCAVALAIIIWAVVTSLMELSSVWYW